MRQVHLKTEKTARYFILGEPTNKIEHVWFVLHGYGQLAEFFIKSFESLDNGKNLIVAPEGFHRFYLKGFNGRIGASWMTKEDRENDIKDYINFLNKVYDDIMNDVDSAKISINLLGFSQGTATVTRWFIQRKMKCEKLILWAHTVPPDTDFTVLKNLLKETKLYIVYGDKDEFVNAKRLEKELNFLKEKEIEFTFQKFDGTHSIDEKTLTLFLKK